MNNPEETNHKNTPVISAKKTQKISSCAPKSMQDYNATGQTDLPTVAAVSHTGFYRSNNEDCYGYHVSHNNKVRLLAVADGIGGHGNGDRASKLLIQELLNFWRKNEENITPENWQETVKLLELELFAINHKIHTINEVTGIKVPMGATLALLLLFPGKAITIHAGDSRIYRFRNQTLTQLTEDHSYISEFLKNGTLTKEKAAEHPLAHVILRSIGTGMTCDPEIQIHDLEKDDFFLVCSDGLLEDLTDDDILQIVRKNHSISQTANELLQQTFRNGAHDNVTILCTKYV